MIHLAEQSAQLLATLRGLLPLAGTLLAYEAGVRLQRRLGGFALANPVLIAVLLVTAALAATNTSAADYADSVRPLTLVLGPATVALALPLYRSLPRIRQAFVPVLVGVAAGAITASASAVVIAAALGGPDLLLRSIATKSATAAIHGRCAGNRRRPGPRDRPDRAHRYHGRRYLHLGARFRRRA